MTMSPVVRFEFSTLVASVGVVGLFALASTTRAEAQEASTTAAVIAPSERVADVKSGTGLAAQPDVAVDAPIDGSVVVAELEMPSPASSL